MARDSLERFRETVACDDPARTGLQARVEMLAVYLGMLGADFAVTGPPDLVAHLRVLAGRYGRSSGDVAGPAR